MAKRSHGEGTVYKRPNGTWLAQVSAGGKRLSKTFKTRKEATEWITKTRGQVGQGLSYESSKTTLGELLNDWLELKSSKLRTATIEQYRRESRLYITPGLGSVKLKDLSPAKIQSFYANLLRQNVGLRTIEVCHTVLHGVVKHAQILGLVTQNWAALVEVPRPEETEITPWTESQISQFLISISPEVQAFYRLAFSTGMRRGELIGLQWSDLDWQTRMLKIRRQVYEPDGGGWFFQPPKTERGRRTIKLGINLMAELRRHFTEYLPLAREFAGQKWQEHDLMFPSTVGTPRNGYEVTKNFQRLAVGAGLPKIRFHDIRHTTASILLMQGVPPLKVAALLGESVAVLLKTYAHYIPDDQERSSALMDEITTPTAVEFGAGIATDCSTEVEGERENAKKIE